LLAELQECNLTFSDDFAARQVCYNAAVLGFVRCLELVPPTGNPPPSKADCRKQLRDDVLLCTKSFNESNPHSPNPSTRVGEARRKCFDAAFRAFQRCVGAAPTLSFGVSMDSSDALSVELDAAPVTVSSLAEGVVQVAVLFSPADPAAPQVEINLGSVAIVSGQTVRFPFDPSSTIFAGATSVYVLVEMTDPSGQSMIVDGIDRDLNYRSTDLNIDQRLNNWDVSIAIDRVMNGQMSVQQAVEVIEDVLSNGTP
jgi:hypothetical protein